MLLFALSGFLNGFSCLIFGTLIYLRNRKSRVYLFFYLSILAAAIWALSYGMWQLMVDKELAIFWCKMLCFGTSLFPVFCMHLVIALLDREKAERKILIFGYIQTFVYLIFGLTPLVVAGARPMYEFLWWPIPGFLYFCYMVFCYFGLLGYAVFLLFKSYSEATGIKKEQIKYTTIALLFPVLGAATNFPYWWGIHIPPYGNLFSFLYPFIIGYIISRYLLIDVRFLVGRISVYIFSLLSVILVDFGLIFIYEKNDNFLPLHGFFVLISIASIYFYQLFYKFYEKNASKIFFYKIYSFQKAIAKLSGELISVLNLEKLNSLIIQTLSGEMGLNKIAIFFKNPKTKKYQVSKIMGLNEEDVIYLIENKFFTNYIETHKTPFPLEEFINIKLEKENSYLKQAIEIMKKIDPSLFLPLLTSEKVVGCIILGRKLSGDIYSKNDVDLLFALSNQISIAMENAYLYNQVQDLSLNLQQKVQEQTRELRQAYQTEKVAREELEKLDQTKNQFLLAVQHHLRTPLTVMKWNSNMILEGKAGKQNKKTVEIIGRFQKSTENLIKMVNEFLDITQFQLGKEMMNLKPNISLIEIFNEILPDLEFQAKGKGIKLDFVCENLDDHYNIKADKEKIKAALYNIADNAVKYTEKGTVNISLSRVDNKIIIQIKDTGIGISKENIGQLFVNAFQRGENAQKTFATGRGIGLYISNQIIKAHNGLISAFSDGPGKGSCFIIKI